MASSGRPDTGRGGRARGSGGEKGRRKDSIETPPAAAGGGADAGGGASQGGDHQRLRRVQSAGACLTSRGTSTSSRRGDPRTARDVRGIGLDRHSNRTQVRTVGECNGIVRGRTLKHASTAGRHRAARDVEAISKLVSRKLDVYLSDVRREEGFDASGGRRVMSAGHVVCRSEMPSFRANSAENGNKSNRRPREDVDQIRQVATTLLDTQIPNSVNVIHQVRPLSATSSLLPLSVQNFRIHFGTVLNIDKYLEYYRQHGLSGGAAERTKRQHKQQQLKKLQLRQAARNETNRTDQVTKAQQKANSDEHAQRTCEIYTLTTPRYLESSWDIAASVRHQMRSFSVDEIRKLRHPLPTNNTQQSSSNPVRASHSEAYPVRVCVDEDETTDALHQVMAKNTDATLDHTHNTQQQRTANWRTGDIPADIQNAATWRRNDDDEFDAFQLNASFNSSYANNRYTDADQQSTCSFSVYDD